MSAATKVDAADLRPSAGAPGTDWFYPDKGRITLIEENDALAPDPTDRHYTQGFRASYLSGPLRPEVSTWWFPGLPGLAFDPTRENTRRYEVTLGQSLFTPDRTRFEPDPRDRGYAGWLYAGVALLQETDRRSLENLELLVGVVGPSALGREVHEGFHDLLGQDPPRGWDTQLRDEPAVVLSYERKWRFEQELGGGLAADFIPEAGVSVGNVFTYAQAGALVRFGSGLGADYGQPRIRPGLSGTTWYNPGRLNGHFGWNIFAGVQGRAVAHNIFLDGSLFRDDRGVDSRPLVADLVGGVAFSWSDCAKLSFSVTHRTEEFKGQDGADQFGAITLSFRLP